MTVPNDQFGFDALLQEGDATNAARKFEQTTAHLPADMERAIPFHREQIKAHDVAMRACDFDAAYAIREEAHVLARKLNGGDLGILAHEDAPGRVLAKTSAAEEGICPLWGQDGTFTTKAAGLRLNVTVHGMFGIGATSMPYVGFSVRAVQFDKPFLSEIGYRSFLGVSLPPVEGRTPEGFVQEVIRRYIKSDLKGKLVRINSD